MVVSEFLYPVLEDFKMEVGTEEDTTTIELPQFTVVGATTEGGSLAPPLYDRFGIKHHLHTYEVDELTELVLNSSEKLNMTISVDIAREIARRSRGTPRIANHYLKWFRDYIEAGSCSASLEAVSKSFELLGISSEGLTEQDHEYLKVLRTSKKAVGLKTLVASTNIDEDTIMNTIEPFLLRLGLIQRTQKGRTPM